MQNEIVIKMAQNTADFLAAKTLILEYVEWLGIDLSFQNFDTEMATLPVTYGNGNGALFIALQNNNAVGVAGIKRFTATACEVKRMFVQPGSRGLGVGQLLLTACIARAKKLHYETIKLDTAGFMTAAIQLYTNNGFAEIPAYRHNPYEEAKYFELELKDQ